MSPSLCAAPCQPQAVLETTKRVLAQAVNDGLASAYINVASSQRRWLYVCRPDSNADSNGIWIKCALKTDTHVEIEGGQIIGFLHPDSLRPPVWLQDSQGNVQEELQPGPICQVIAQWQPDPPSSNTLSAVLQELQNSAGNQVKWLAIGASRFQDLQLTSPLIDWERSVLRGHPTHPLHRTCLALPPLKPIEPHDLATLLEPDISFLSVPRADLAVSGPFEELLMPLLNKLGVQHTLCADDVVVPCLSYQLPCIRQAYPNARHIKTVQHCAQSHISMRTVSLNPELNYSLHLKFSLNCQITSAVRNLHSQTVVAGPLISEMLKSLVPGDLWIFENVACATGALGSASPQYLACVLRKSLEEKAESFNETLIPAAALYQIPINGYRTYAETLFKLDTLDKKKEWFREYTTLLFTALLPPLVSYGIGLESHAQNVVVRIYKPNRRISGFAVRDFDGLRIHRPTFEQYATNNKGGLSFLPPGSRNAVDDIHIVWNKVHHALFYLHVGQILYSLGLESVGGWAIVRDELAKTLSPEKGGMRARVYAYFLKETVPFKCSLRMRLMRVAGDRYDRELPNILLRN